MKFEHCHFSGKTIRPIPTLYQDDEMILIATPWNTNAEETQSIIYNFIKYYRRFFLDTQATLPFEQMHSLSIHENYIRTSLLQLNRSIFSQHNQEEFSMGFEFSIFLKTNSEIILAQIGHPQVYLSRKNLPLQPVGSVFSLSTLYSQENENFPPLPHNLMGVFSDISVWIGSFKYQKDDEFVLLSKDFIPLDFLSSNQRTLDHLESLLSQDQESFWMGKVHSL